MQIAFQHKPISINAIAVMDLPEIVIRHLCTPMCIACIMILIGGIVPVIIAINKIYSRTIIGGIVQIKRLNPIATSRFPQTKLSRKKISDHRTVSRIGRYGYAIAICGMDSIFRSYPLVGMSIDVNKLTGEGIICINIHSIHQ